MEDNKVVGLKNDKKQKEYEVSTSFDIDDMTTVDKVYTFKRPSTGSYDRYIKSMGQSITKASTNFVLDNIVADQREQFIKDLDEYPAMALSISDKLLAMLGYSKDINLKRL